MRKALETPYIWTVLIDSLRHLFLLLQEIVVEVFPNNKLELLTFTRKKLDLLAFTRQKNYLKYNPKHFMMCNICKFFINSEIN